MVKRVLLCFAVVLGTATGPFDAHAEGWRAYLSPGPVGKAHQDVAGKCDRCHLVFKGLPNEKCLSCHSAIDERLREKVGFHANEREAACIKCHVDHKGADHAMTRAEALESFDHGLTVFPLEGAHTSLDCAQCHDRPLEEMKNACLSCHEDSHEGAFGASCQSCHGSVSWQEGLKSLADHTVRTDGGHAELACADCHSQGQHLEKEVACASCHERAHGGTEEACDGCHSVSGFKPAKFDHDLCPCAFPGKHKTASCLSCHEGFRFTDTPTLCSGCHVKELPHEPLGECSVCHSALSWTKNRFNHNRQSRFKLQNSHLEVDCARCHYQKRRGRRNFKAAPTNCYGCHKKEGVEAHGDFGRCEQCHTTEGFEDSTFDHASTGFALDGRHDDLGCQDCHAQKIEGYPKKRSALTPGSTPTQQSGTVRSVGASVLRTAGAGGQKTSAVRSNVAPVPRGNAARPHVERWRPKLLYVPRRLISMLIAANPPRDAAQPAPSLSARTSSETSAAGAVVSPQSSSSAPAEATRPEKNSQGVDDRACGHCHADPHQQTAGGACTRCHSTEAWRPSTFGVDRHATTQFPLKGAHQETKCTLCHVDSALSGQPTACASCHVDVHQGRFGDRCADCHNERAFSPTPGFDHARTGFALTGPHTRVDCLACHGAARAEDLTKRPNPKACATCHAPGHGPELGADCQSCHPLTDLRFADADRKRFDHSTTPFPLERRHRMLKCQSCHPAPDNGRPSLAPTGRCMTCHLDPHKGNNSNDCALCHQPDRWRLVRFDHDAAGWPLRGRHFVTPCASCHTNQRWFGLTTDCFDCHAQDAARGASVRPNQHPFGRLDCTDCHFSGWTWRM